jgi:hypothetical protein
MQENKKNLEIFNNICEFVSALSETFPNVKSIQLYERLVSKTTFKDKVPIAKHTLVFEEFINKYKKFIVSNNFKDIKNQRDAIIRYSDNVYISISYCVEKSPSEETTEVIRQYLLTIYAILHPDDEKALTTLEKSEKASEVPPNENLGILTDGIQSLLNMNNQVDTSSKEGAFVQDIMLNFQNIAKDIKPPSTEGEGATSSEVNPMELVSSIMKNEQFTGVMGKMFSSLTDNLNNGDMDIMKLVGSMSGVMNTLVSNVNPNAGNFEDNFVKKPSQEGEDKKPKKSKK